MLPTLEQLRSLLELMPDNPKIPQEPAVVPWRIERRFTPEVLDEIVERYRAGDGTPALCLEYGISKPSILELLHSRGVTMRRQPLTPTQRTEAVRLYREGLALAPTAKCLGSSIGAVRRALLEEGVRLRPRPGWEASERVQ